MITEIGIVAGEIWHYLDSHGEVLFSQLVEGIRQPRDLTLMSVGWLAREGHVILKQENLEPASRNDYRVWLRKS